MQTGASRVLEMTQYQLRKYWYGVLTGRLLALNDGEHFIADSQVIAWNCLPFPCARVILSSLLSSCRVCKYGMRSPKPMVRQLRCVKPLSHRLCARCSTLHVTAFPFVCAIDVQRVFHVLSSSPAFGGLCCSLLSHANAGLCKTLITERVPCSHVLFCS